MRNFYTAMKALIFCGMSWLSLMWPVYVLRHGRPPILFMALTTLAKEWGVWVSVAIIIVQAYLIIRLVCWLLKIGVDQIANKEK